MLKQSIIVFIKAPVPGRVKTRLCPPLSPKQAAELYVAFVKDTIEAAANVPGAEVELAYDAAEAYPDTRWLDGSVPYFHQQGADLGARMIHAFNRAFASGARQAVIIGSDMPTLESKSISRAFELLARKDVVLGPAFDGGYYLVGLKKSAPSLFEGITWSSGRVFGETLDRIRQNGFRLGSLDRRSDVDTGPDLKSLSRSLSRNNEGTARFTRKVLAQWRRL